MFKIKFWLLFIFLNNSFMMVIAQQEHEIFLSNYTFSAHHNEIGSLSTLSNDDIESVSLLGKDARAFKVTKDNRLWVKPGYNRKDGRYNLVVKARTKTAMIIDTFRIISDQFNRNKVIAHRGAWKNTGVPENSIAALSEAVKLGCEGSEFDVWMSEDSVLFIHHDVDIQGYNIEKTSSKILSKLKLTNGEHLPELRQYLQAGTKQHTSKLILEIKPSELGKDRAMKVTQKVVELVKQFKAQAWVEYISFDFAICHELRRLSPYSKVAYLNGDKAPSELADANLSGFDYHFSVLKKNRHWLQEALQLKLVSNSWTVNDAETMEWLLTEKIDLITTNEPELLLKIIGRLNRPD